MSKKKNNFDINKILHVLAIAVIVAIHILSIYVIINTGAYAELNPSIYTKAIIIIILLLAVIDALYIIHLKTKERVFRIFSVVLAILVFLGIGYTYTIVSRVNNVVSEVTSDSGVKQYETMVVSFVTYDNENIETLDDVSGEKVGVLVSTSEVDIASLGKQHLEDDGISYDLVEFDKLNDLFMALISEEIECAILPGNYYDTFASNEGYEEYLSKTTTIAGFTKEVEVTDNESANKDITTEPFTVLLIGYAPESGGGGLSDSMILASVNPLTMQVSLTSIARDSYVPIACYADNSKDKLTHARAVSRDCTMATIEDLLDINIDFYAEVNFTGVVEIVDALDGIWIESPVEFVGQTSSTERGTYTVWVDEGGQWANGEQALAFSRERYSMPNGDYDRQINQQQVISQIVGRTLELNDVNQMLDVMAAAGSNIKTNMGTSQIVSLMNLFLNINYSEKLDIMNVIDITNARVTGYSSWTYNEAMQLPLWCYPLWQGSVDDNEYLINLTLDSLDNPERFYSYQYNSEYPYYPTLYLTDWYDEKQIHEVLPAFVLDFEGGNIQDVRDWCNENGVELNEIEIMFNSPEYSDDYEDGLVLEQSERYGIKASNVDVLTVKFIRKVTADELVPDFYDRPYSELLEWASTNNIALTVNWINSDDELYDLDKAMLCLGNQSVEPNNLNEDISEMSISVYDYPYVTGFESLATETELVDWVALNLISTDKLTVKYIYGDETLDGKIVDGTLVWSNPTGYTSDVNAKSNSEFRATVYKNDPDLIVKHTVQFLDINGVELDLQEIEEGEAATAPAAPEVEGKVFTGWSADFSNVQADLVISAVYEDEVVEPTPTPTPEPTAEPTESPAPEGETGNTDTVDTGESA